MQTAEVQEGKYNKENPLPEESDRGKKYNPVLEQLEALTNDMRKLLTIIATLVATMTQAQGVIDVHSHIITPEFVSALEKDGRLLDEGFPLPKWDAEAQLKWMDEAGIQTSVLTLAAPQPQAQEGGALVRLAEIEVYPQYLTEYLAAAKDIQQRSLAEEPASFACSPHN